MRRGNLHFVQTWLRKNHNAIKLLIAMLMFASLACNAFAGNLEPLPEPPQISERPTSTATPTTMVATVTLDGTALADDATVSMLVDLNVRSGPGVQYERVGFLSKGTSVAVTGVDKQSGWWKIQCPESLNGEQCWVSGGSQYVTVNNVQGVPTAVVPATPTTVPPDLEEGQGLLAYLNNGQLYVAGLELNQSPPLLSSDARQVSRADGVQRFSFSPDGRRIAYLAGTESSNSLNIVNVDGGDHRTLLTSSILPVAEAQEAAQVNVLIDYMQWSPDAEGVAFNTTVLNQGGPGRVSQEDLWFATLEGELDEIFSAGKGGGTFTFESDGRVLLSRADEITRATLKGQEQNTILRYEPINTASEYVYYPSPQLTSSGTHIAVPASDPWITGAQTTLWQAPSIAPAIEIGRVTNIVFNQPLVWSFDGQQTAFIQQSASGEQPVSRMVIAEGDGSGAMPYAGGAGLNFFEWKPKDDQFLYAGTGFYAIGRPQAPPKQMLLPAGQTAAEARWLAGDNYILTIIDPLNQLWEIQSANASGDMTLLANGHGQPSTIEIWLPMMGE